MRPVLLLRRVSRLKLPDPQQAEPTAALIVDGIFLHRPELRAWVSYDWANSVFFTTVIQIFPIYFAKVVVTGYPLLFNEPSRYQWAARANVDTAALNDAVAAAAAANGAVFVDVEPSFAGHGIGSPSPWINDWSWLRTTDGFHPNATGYAAYATEIRKVIG